MTNREVLIARFAAAMIAEKQQAEHDAAFTVPAVVRDTARALDRLRDVIRTGSIRTGYRQKGQ